MFKHLITSRYADKSSLFSKCILVHVYFHHLFSTCQKKIFRLNWGYLAVPHLDPPSIFHFESLKQFKIGPRSSKIEKKNLPALPDYRASKLAIFLGRGVRCREQNCPQPYGLPHGKILPSSDCVAALSCPFRIFVEYMLRNALVFRNVPH